MNNQNICRICGSQDLRKVVIGTTDLLNCMRCGIHYAETFSTEENLSDYYKNKYEITTTDIADIEFRRLFRSTENLELVSEVMKYKKPESSILDIGCDKGFFIDQARRLGFECKGIELSESAVEYAKRSGLDICDGLDKLDKKYDVAVMWHSLEHFTEPAEFLSELKKHLNADGYLFIRVPAFDSFWSKILKSKWIWFQPRNHYFHYSLKSLKILLEKNGYVVEKIEHRKPNNCTTMRQYSTAKRIMKKQFGYSIPLRKKLIRIYEDITAVELFAVAKPK